MENGEWRIVDCHWFTLHTTFCLPGWGGEPGIYDTASISGVLFFVGLRFSVSSWLYTQTSFFFFLKIFYSVLYIYIFLHIASLALQFTFLFVSFLGVLLLFHRSGQIVVVNQM